MGPSAFMIKDEGLNRVEYKYYLLSVGTSFGIIVLSFQDRTLSTKIIKKWLNKEKMQNML